MRLLVVSREVGRCNLEYRGGGRSEYLDQLPASFVRDGQRRGRGPDKAHLVAREHTGCDGSFAGNERFGTHNCASQDLAGGPVLQEDGQLGVVLNDDDRPDQGARAVPQPAAPDRADHA